MPPMTKTTGARAAVAAGAGGIASATLVIRLAHLWCTIGRRLGMSYGRATNLPTTQALDYSSY